MSDEAPEPLVRVPRHDAELAGLNLLGRLDDASVTTALNDHARVETVIARFRDGVLTSLQNQTELGGFHRIEPPRAPRWRWA